MRTSMCTTAYQVYTSRISQDVPVCVVVKSPHSFGKKERRLLRCEWLLNDLPRMLTATNVVMVHHGIASAANNQGFRGVYEVSYARFIVCNVDASSERHHGA